MAARTSIQIERIDVGDLIEYFEFLHGARSDKTIQIFNSAPNLAERFGIKVRLAQQILATYVSEFTQGVSAADLAIRAKGHRLDRTNLKVHFPKLS